jgi:hypothetical protein
LNQETVTYLTNIVIGVILAALATNYWRQQRESSVLTYWAVAAWVMTTADVLFAARPWLTHAAGRLVPTLCVTVGHAVLFLGAEKTARLAPRWRLAAVVAAVHAAGLVGFLFVESVANFRMVFNGLIWGGFSIASALCLRRAAAPFWQSAFAPASAFWAHGAFHTLRVVLAIVFTENGWARASAALQIAGDLEVSFFMVALFVGLLVAHLQVRHEELMRAQVEVRTLSGLLPICAWCKKVRDDDGYWEQVEDYFAKHSRLKFTHGVCLDCVDKLNQSAPEPLAPR